MHEVSEQMYGIFQFRVDAASRFAFEKLDNYGVTGRYSKTTTVLLLLSNVTVPAEDIAARQPLAPA